MQTRYTYSILQTIQANPDITRGDLQDKFGRDRGAKHLSMPIRALIDSGLLTIQKRGVAQSQRFTITPQGFKVLELIAEVDRIEGAY